MSHPRFRDPALLFLMEELKKHNEGLPPSKRMGFRAYLRKQGILHTEREQSIRRHEIPFSRLGPSEAAMLGEVWTEDDE